MKIVEFFFEHPVRKRTFLFEKQQASLDLQFMIAQLDVVFLDFKSDAW